MIRIERQHKLKDPLKPFSRLVFDIEKSVEKDREIYFCFVLTLYPTSLFIEGIMARANNKSTLETQLIKMPYHGR